MESVTTRITGPLSRTLEKKVLRLTPCVYVLNSITQLRYLNLEGKLSTIWMTNHNQSTWARKEKRGGVFTGSMCAGLRIGLGGH